MDLAYAEKKTEKEVLESTAAASLSSSWNDIPNKIIQGENLSVLKYLLEKQNLKLKIDLIYIDPPFATKRIFTTNKDRISTISSSKNDTVAYRDELTGANFLEFLRERLIFLRELMSERASIYVHIDYKIGHYVKIIMDEIFGAENFRNDITRVKCNPKNFKRKAYGNIKDLILFYSKGRKSNMERAEGRIFGKRFRRPFQKNRRHG